MQLVYLALLPALLSQGPCRKKMKITKQELKEIIKEELASTLVVQEAMSELRSKWFKIQSQSDRDPNRRSEYLVALQAEKLIRLIEEHSEFENKYNTMMGRLDRLEESDLKAEAISDVQGYLASVKKEEISEGWGQKTTTAQVDQGIRKGKIISGVKRIVLDKSTPENTLVGLETWIRGIEGELK